MGRIVALMVLAMLPAAGAHAAASKDLCSERPGITTNECVIDPGHLQIETGLVDWTLDRRSGDRKDSILFGDSLLRYGIGHGLELRLGWTPFGYERDREDGAVDRYRRVGDVTLGLKANLIDAQTHGDVGLSLAVIPFATLPAGRYPIGAGTWGAGAQAPVGYRFDKAFKIEFTPMVEEAPDEDGDGRHLRYSGAVGIKYNPAERFSVELEEQAARDRDPDREERGTLVRTGLSGAFQPSDHLQLDIGSNIGINRKTPDAEVYAGFTRLF